jgi:tRNA(fMet)-specific endonuclease VapC
MKYLLDTNICIYYLKGMYRFNEKVEEVGMQNCAISELTIAELKYGVEKSEQKQKNEAVMTKFVANLTVIPILPSFDVYAKEKVRLRKAGTPIDDFDLLIGSTAIANGLVLVSRNTKHFERLSGIRLENWVSKKS